MSSSAVPVLKVYRFATQQVETFKEFSKETRFDSFSTAFSVSPDGNGSSTRNWTKPVAI